MEIELPDGTILDAPDDADPSVVAKAYLAKNQPDNRGDLGRNVRETANSMYSIPGMGVLGNMAAGMARLPGKIAGGLAGAGSLITGQGLDASADTTRKVSNALGGNYQAPEATANDPLMQALGWVGDKGNQLMAPVDKAINSTPAGETALTATNQAVDDLSSFLPLAGGAKSLAGTLSRKITPQEADLVRRGVAPSSDGLQMAKDRAYKEVADAGLNTTSDELKTSVANVRKIRGATKPLDPEAFDKLFPNTSSIVKAIDKTEGELSLTDVEAFRSLAGKAQFEKNATDLDREGLQRVRDALDDHVEKMATDAGDPSTHQALSDARNLYSRWAKDQDLKDMIDIAYQKADAGSGTRYSNLQASLRKLSVDPKRLRRFTPDEQVAIRQVAVATKPEAVLGALSKLGGHLTSTGLGAAGYATNGIVGGAAAWTGAKVGGIVGGKAAEALQRARVEQLGDMFRLGPVGSAPLWRDTPEPPKGPLMLPSPSTVSPAPGFTEVPNDISRTRHPGAPDTVNPPPAPLSLGPMGSAPAPSGLMPEVGLDEVLPNRTKTRVENRGLNRPGGVIVRAGDDVDSASSIKRGQSRPAEGGFWSEKAQRTIDELKRRTDLTPDQRKLLEALERQSKEQAKKPSEILRQYRRSSGLDER